MRTSVALPLLFWAVTGSASLVTAQSVGTFTYIGDMTTARAGHTATLLLNGKVLIAGGSSAPNQFLASAELYDPAIPPSTLGAFSRTGNMTPRGGHTATLLADGRVLIAGGYGSVLIPGGYGNEPLTSAELYDSSTGAFSPTGTMTRLRGAHAATLLRDGRVLMTGCAIPCNSAIAEIYDPTTERFAAAGAPDAASGPAILLADGRVLITGGCPADFRGTKAQLFDPGTGAFISTALMPIGCATTNTATLLMNGKVLVGGGSEYPDPFFAALYDPRAGTFTSLEHAIGLESFSTGTLLPEGTVLITGSNLPWPGIDDRAELYIPATGTFVAVGSMAPGRVTHTATFLPNGTVLIAGGWSAEIYQPSVLQPGPALLSISGDGRGQGAILHAGTSRLASPTDPAVAGDYLEIYVTGLTDGSVIPPQVILGGRMTEVLWFGRTPGFAALNQINVRVPSGIAPGPAVRVRINYIGRPSNEVTIAVQ